MPRSIIKEQSCPVNRLNKDARDQNWGINCYQVLTCPNTNSRALRMYFPWNATAALCG